ncbi:MAG: 30S ribosomal protein S8 [Anaerolineae bacterium]|nr:30S ribosomal protein S8 [Anaerolineae bacterium]
MSVSDPIADMLTRIRNALMARHVDAVIPYSKMKEDLAHVLHDEGYIESYHVDDTGSFKTIVIQLKYVGLRRERRPVISGLKRVSRPGRRFYTKYSDIPWVLSGMGIAILTTPNGVITGEQARRQRIGGEVLCYVW